MNRGKAYCKSVFCLAGHAPGRKVPVILIICCNSSFCNECADKHICLYPILRWYGNTSGRYKGDAGLLSRLYSRHYCQGHGATALQTLSSPQMLDFCSLVHNPIVYFPSPCFLHFPKFCLAFSLPLPEGRAVRALET